MPSSNPSRHAEKWPKQPGSPADWRASIAALRDQIALNHAELDATRSQLARGYRLLNAAQERLSAARSLLADGREVARLGDG